MKNNDQCAAWIDKVKLLEWLELQLYFSLEDGASAFDAYRDVISYVRQMSTHVRNLPDIGVR